LIYPDRQVRKAAPEWRGLFLSHPGPKWPVLLSGGAELSDVG
jgi:hypothetical protein